MGNTLGLRPLLWTLAFAQVALTPSTLTGQTAPSGLPDFKLFTGGYVNAIAVESDGKVIVGGLFNWVNGTPRRNVARLNTDGSVDPLWDPAPDGVIYSLAVTSDAVFIGGAFSKIGGQARGGIAKVDLGTGQADLAWNPTSGNGLVAIYTMTVSGIFIYVGGQFDSIGGQIGGGIARLHIDGAGDADPGWNPDADRTVQTIVIDGPTVYVGGDFGVIGRWSRNGLARLDAGFGMADPAWDPSPDGSVDTLVVDDSNVYVGGAFASIGGQSCTNLAKIDKNSGLADPSWNANPDGRVLGVAQSSGSLFVAGSFARIGGEPRNGIAKLSSDGTGAVDLTWDARIDDSVSQPVSVLAVNGPDIYVGGHFHFASAVLALGLAKLDFTTGSRLNSFPVQVQLQGEVKAIAEQPDGGTVFGGNFYLAGDVPRSNLARLGPDQTLDRVWNPGPNGLVLALAADSTNVYVGGSFSRIGGVVRTNLAKVSSSGVGIPDGVWNPNPEGGYQVSTVALGADSLYVGGAFTSVGRQVRRNLAKISTAGPGLADPDWAPDVQTALGGEIDQVTLADGFLYVAGGFSTLGGQLRNTLARLSPTGTGAADPSWAPDPTGPVNAFALQRTNLYAVTGTEVIRLDTTGLGRIDPMWDTTADARIASIAARGEELYIGGSFASIGGVPRRFLARLPLGGGGAADPSWVRTIDDTWGRVDVLLPTTTGIYVGGNFTSLTGTLRVGLGFLSEVPEVRAPLLLASPVALLLLPDPADGPEVTGFVITEITGISLFLSDNVTPVQAGDFITVAQGIAGLWYSGTGSISAVSAVNDTPLGAGAAAATIQLASIPSPRVSNLQFLSGGQIGVQLETMPGAVCSILVSSDLGQSLTNWTELLRITNTTGTNVFTDQPLQPNRRFYRAVQW